MVEPLPSSVEFIRLRADQLSVSTNVEVSRERIECALFDNAEFAGTMLSLLNQHRSALADRSTMPGHLTGSALVVDEDGDRVLLMLHTKLERWLQPGGHADGDHELAGVALREAEEETGISGLSVLVPAVDLDIHEIPERRNEPRHLHLDVRFVVVAPRGSEFRGNNESRELKWVTPDQVASLADEPGLLRLVERGLLVYRRYQEQQEDL